MKLLPRHSHTEKCNCNDKLPHTEATQECLWMAVERDSVCDCAISIYEKLKTYLISKNIDIHGIELTTGLWSA